VREGEDDDVGLDEEELEILKDAGVIAMPSKTRKRKSSRTPAKHIVFVENEEEGMYGRSTGIYWLNHDAICHAARQFVTKQNDLPKSRPESTDTINAIDLGWREPKKVKKEKKKDHAIDATDSTDALEIFEAPKVRLPSALLNIFCTQRGRRPIEHVC